MKAEVRPAVVGAEPAAAAAPVAHDPAPWPAEGRRRSDCPWSELTAVWGGTVPSGRAPRVLGLFAHPDDEVFCVGGTIARCAEAGAETAVVSLTQGEAGQIRDAAAATRRTLGAVRVRELGQAADALGVHHVTCLDLGDGRLGQQPLEEVAPLARTVIDQFEPDVVVTFGPGGAFGHPDHGMSCLATVEAVRAMADSPRLLHARDGHYLHRDYLHRDEAAFEDGTVDDLNLSAVGAGLHHLDRIGPDATHRRVVDLTRWLLDALTGLRHSSGLPVVQIHGSLDTTERGGTRTFLLRDRDGRPVDDRRVEELAHQANISLPDRARLHLNRPTCWRADPTPGRRPS